jgi:hypothetical protein
MLQVASVSFGCCICFTHMFQVYVINISSALDVGCIQVFHISEVESHGGTPRLPAEDGTWRARASGRGVLGPTVGVRSAPRVVRTGRARSHYVFRIPPTQRERGGGQGKERRVQRGGAGVRTCGERGGVREKERREWWFLRVRVTEEAWASECALLSRHQGASISQSRILD